MPLDAGSVRARLPRHELLWLETAGSTMTEAARLAAAGCPDGTVVGADEQTAGQGRHGRNWHSEKETGLYISIVLRPELPPEALLSLTLALGLATRQAILEATGVACGLKWPNDVLAGGKKCAGILAQGTRAAVIAGIGVNVNQENFPPELAGTATSLRLISGRFHSREDLLVQLLLSVSRFTALLREEGSEPVIRLYSVAARKGVDHAAGN
jgi:BirA family transcriptional regulator, biotin operon repressor / biotin---[acetyl-CoA-carboxylase] ligase